MKAATQKLIAAYVNDNIDIFHNKRIEKLTTLKLESLLKRKNPYLFRAKNVLKADELVTSILDAHLSSSEEELFGGFLEALAIFVAKTIGDGQKSTAGGMDLEFNRDKTRYVVAIKSGPNWGNSQQYKALRSNFANAVKILKQSPHIKHVQPVLGICYGRVKTSDNGLYLKLVGQTFWHFVSDGDANLYTDLIKPLGYEAKKHNENYIAERASAYTRFEREFMNNFCHESGAINWPKVVAFNSGNLKL